MSDPMRILVTGSRTCTTERAITVVESTLTAVLGSLGFQAMERGVIIVHGQCPKGGVDLIAHRWAEGDPDTTPEPHPADWKRHGRAAGPIRNAQMVALGADLCLAFPGPTSTGTWDCIRKAVAAGIPTQIYPLEKP